MRISLKYILIIVLLFSSTSFTKVSMNLEKNKIKDDINVYSATILFKAGSPIEIFSDKDFLSYSFPGTGSKEDPYRIEYLEIITSNNNGIWIENVSRAFIIQNCRVSASFGAIRLFNCTSDSILLSNNICTGGYLGIFVAKTQFIKLINNTCMDCYDGININDSHNSLIENNTLIKNHSGLRVTLDISFSKIINNYCINNYNGMYITNSRSLLLKNNYIYNNVNGILLSSTNSEYASQNCVLVNNLFDNNTSYALILTAFLEQSFTRNNQIYHNSFINNNKNTGSQAKDMGKDNMWYNESLKEGNYWSDWIGFGSYSIDGDANSIDIYPLEKPLHKTYTNPPLMFIGRVLLIIGITSIIIISFLLILIYIKRYKPKIKLKNRRIKKNSLFKTMYPYFLKF